MCGIAGFYLRQRHADAEILRAMCDRIRHRGPDEDGCYVHGGCAIGMRRLSIIDLAGGRQPIANEDGSVRVVFNGEIYNHGELRRELEAHGHRFTTHCDTETLAHGYEQWGRELMPRLRGMFAFAIWDAKRRKILLARDRFGKKPLYYALPPGGLYFASEIKSLRAAGLRLEPDREALKLYFQFGYVPDPWSAYEAVRKVTPGGWLEYDWRGHAAQGRYWRLPEPAEEEPCDLTEDSAQRRVRELFDEAVRLRMIADVPLGAFLSGGIDSSLVVASMARQSAAPVKTFSIGFDEAAYSELRYARLVAAKYGAEHHEIVVRPDAAALAQEMPRWFDEPFADTAAIPNYLLAVHTRKHVKVALSGDGGDEMFGGYTVFRRLEELARWDRMPRLLRRGVESLSEQLSYSAYGKNWLRMISRPSGLERYFELNYTPYFLRDCLLDAEWMLPAEAAFLRRTFTDCLLPNSASALSQAMYFEATANLTGGMLVKVDRTSMAASLEVRCPLLDHELAEFAMSIPHAWKIRGGRGKDILIRSMQDRLPPELLRRGKQGFEPPLAVWLRGPLREMLWDHLTGARFLGRGMVSAGFVRHLLEEHQSGRRDNNRFLWSLLMLELWMRDVEPVQSYAQAS